MSFSTRSSNGHLTGLICVVIERNQPFSARDGTTAMETIGARLFITKIQEASNDLQLLTSSLKSFESEIRNIQSEKRALWMRIESMEGISSRTTVQQCKLELHQLKVRIESTRLLIEGLEAQKVSLQEHVSAIYEMSTALINLSNG